MLSRLAAVRMADGATALARTPCVFSSCATDRMSEMTPALAAAYAAMSADLPPGRAFCDPMKSTVPCAARTIGRKARVAW